MDLNNLKKNYEQSSKKYKLPSFNALNIDFEIDKLDKNTDFLLRTIRKLMMEKVVNSINFLEMLLSPINTPRMYLSYIRTMSVEDKNIIDKIYSNLADLTLFSLDLEIDSTEKKEADLIQKVFNEWNSLKPLFRQLLNNVKKPKNSVIKKERSYFG